MWCIFFSFTESLSYAQRALNKCDANLSVCFIVLNGAYGNLPEESIIGKTLLSFHWIKNITWIIKNNDVVIKF